MKIVYMSLTGQTKKFVQKLSMEALYLSREDEHISVNEDYICIIPTYDRQSLAIIENFIVYENNSRFLRGVVGSGNRNFNTMFCISAKHLAKKYNVPLLHCFEFQGEDADVEKVISEVNKLGESEAGK